MRRLFTFCLSREKEFKPVQTSMQRSLGGHVRAKYATLRSNLSIQSWVLFNFIFFSLVLVLFIIFHGWSDAKFHSWWREGTLKITTPCLLTSSSVRFVSPYTSIVLLISCFTVETDDQRFLSTSPGNGCKTKKIRKGNQVVTTFYGFTSVLWDATFTHSHNVFVHLHIAY